ILRLTRSLLFPYTTLFRSRAIESGQHRRGRATEGTVARSVVREWRSDDERAPSRIGDRGGIIIRVTVANGCHRAPEVVGVLRVPSTDGCVSQGDVQKCEQARIFFQRVTLRGGDVLRNTIPVPRWCLSAGTVCPK